MKRLVLALAVALAAQAAGCSGCENSVCCAIPGQVVPTILRPSQCTAMGGASVATAMCDVICCESTGGALAPAPRMSCTRVVEPRLCDAPDGS